MRRSTRKPTPWAVICETHGQVFLTLVEYRDQMGRADDPWLCPICATHALWDDDNYEARTIEPSEESLREIPEVDFSQGVRGKYADTINTDQRDYQTRKEDSNLGEAEDD